MADEPAPSHEALTEAVIEAMKLAERGDREAARRRLTGLWENNDADARPYHACILAHYLADLQEELDRELELDRLALVFALRCSDETLRAHHGSLSVAALLPSLYLNLSDSLHRSGHAGQALEALEAGEVALRKLPEDHQLTVAHGLRALRARLGAGTR